MQLWPHVTNWRSRFLKIGFYTSKEGGNGGGGWVSARGAVHMAAALSGRKKALVSTGLAISHGCKKALYYCRNFRGSISATADSFQSGEEFAGQRALTIVGLLMSGHGRGHEP